MTLPISIWSRVPGWVWTRGEENGIHDRQSVTLDEAQEILTLPDSWPQDRHTGCQKAGWMDAISPRKLFMTGTELCHQISHFAPFLQTPGLDTETTATSCDIKGTARCKLWVYIYIWMLSLTSRTLTATLGVL